MFEALKGLFTSKKFWLTLIGTVIVNVMAVLHMPMELILTVAGFFGINGLGIAAQDMGKEAAKKEDAK